MRLMCLKVSEELDLLENSVKMLDYIIDQPSWVFSDKDVESAIMLKHLIEQILSKYKEAESNVT